jgi:hypothetical protein
MNLAVAAFDQRLVALDHAGHLITLVGVNEKDDFVVSQANLLLGLSPQLAGMGA